MNWLDSANLHAFRLNRSLNFVLRSDFSMADQEEEDLRMALRMSMQQWPPEPKRSKPRESGGAPTGSPDDSPEAKSRRLQRELMAAAAEKRLMMSAKPASPARRNVAFPKEEEGVGGLAGDDGRKEVSCGVELSDADSNQLFSMVFGNGVSKGILAQWCNQGIRYSFFFLFYMLE